MNSTNESTDQQQNSNANCLLNSFDCPNVNDFGNIRIGSVSHRRAWESGNVDYQGRDSFSNIQQQLEKEIQLHSFQYHPPQSTTTITVQPNITNVKHSNEKEHQSTWTVKSTIVTTCTQG